MAAMLVYWNNKIFLLWDLTPFLCKLYGLSKFSFILYTNMAAVQTSYKYIIVFLVHFFTWTDFEM